MIFAEDEEQLDKILSCRSRCPTLQKIVVFDMEGLSGFTDPMVMSLAEFMALGRNHSQGNEALWDEMIGSRSADDLAILVYTSGTTGPPKGAMHSNRSVTHQMRHANDLFPSTDAEERLVFLPLCHVAERVGGYYISLALGSVMNFAESPETVPDNLREVQPTAFLAVPRIWEKFYSGITIALKDATPFQNWMYRNALAIGNRMTEYRLEGDTPPLSLRLANRAAYWLVFRNIRRMLGLDRCRLAFTGAAPIAPDLIRWYLALGIDMREVYGQTENCGVATVMPPDRIKLGSVGKAAPWGEVAISPQGEILIKGDFLFMGYLNQPEKTAETIDAKGWLHTGDVGSIDNEGFVKITDRMKDIIITSGGKNITPSEIENQLKFSPYVSDAVVIGDKRPYLTCLRHDRSGECREVRAGPRHSLHQLCEPVPRGRDPGPDPARDRGGQRQFRARRDHQEVLPDRAPADARGRGIDADHEAEAQFREQALRHRDQRHVWRAGGGVAGLNGIERNFENGEGLRRPHPSLNTGQRRGDCNVEIVQGAGPCGERPCADPSAGRSPNQGHQ